MPTYTRAATANTADTRIAAMCATVANTPSSGPVASAPAPASAAPSRAHAALRIHGATTET